MADSTLSDRIALAVWPVSMAQSNPTHNCHPNVKP
jgi:hypothetical protein